MDGERISQTDDRLQCGLRGWWMSAKNRNATDQVSLPVQCLVVARRNEQTTAQKLNKETRKYRQAKTWLTTMRHRAL